MRLEHKFIDSAPQELEDGVLYVSIRFRLAMHLCCCGCKNKVVTPLSPVRWEITFNGKTVSLYPSIGNWNFECQSHYWITNGEVLWAESWSKGKIKYAKKEAQERRIRYFDKPESAPDSGIPIKKETLSNKFRKWVKKSLKLK